MFITELSPLLQEFVQKPVAFAGGFVSGLLRLDLKDEPVSSWLGKQGVAVPPTSQPTPPAAPKSITID
jgi:hypothetical protein